MNILILGGNGQLGQEFFKEKDSFNFNFFFTDIDDVDVTKFSSLLSFFNKNHIDVCINCSAYTNVDEAEKNEKKCYALNSNALINLINLEKKFNFSLIHFSTDYVFDGDSKSPYKEDSERNPNTIYGKSKLLGENYLKRSSMKFIIIRTSWLYSTYGSNFVKTIIKLSSSKDQIRVINDQRGSPTYANDLAKITLEILSDPNCFNKDQVYHFSNKGSTTWFNFAMEIISYLNIKCNVIPIKSKEFNFATPRPKFSVMSTKKIESHFNISNNNWKKSLRNCLNKIKNE